MRIAVCTSFLSMALAFAATPVAPIRPDPHELATAGVQSVTTPAERTAALSLLERARQNSDMFIPGTPPFELTVSFNASGNVTFTGPGESTDTWVSGRNWRWTASLGSYSQTRTGAGRAVYDDKPVSQVPMRYQMLRGAIFAPIRMSTSGAAIRSVAVESNGRPATCLLLARASLPPSTARAWEETEYCIDNASGLLDIYSEAPGVYVLYGYGQNLQFHGRVVPDHIAIYSGGSEALSAQLTIKDSSVDAAQLAPTEQMLANGPGMAMMYAMRFPMNVPSPVNGSVIQPVIVHATLDQAGRALEEEVTMASDPELAQAAMDAVKNGAFSQNGSPQRDVYINVRFVPAPQ